MVTRGGEGVEHALRALLGVFESFLGERMNFSRVPGQKLVR